MSQTPASELLRWVDYPASAVEGALAGFASRGTDFALDLRADAYGFGVEKIGSIAAGLGFSEALCDEGVTATGLKASDSGSDTWVADVQRAGGQVLSARVVNVKSVPAGEEVSYGGMYRTATGTTLVLVAIGFADGVPRLDPVGGEVDWNGIRLPIAGRIAMDQMILDAGSHTPAIGDEVKMWGGAVSIDEWSAWSGRPVPLLSAGIGPRVHRMGSV